jgi:hypothetical protein
MSDDAGFLARWSQRKVQARQGEVAPEPVEPPEAPMPAPVAPVPEKPPPTMQDVAALTPASDFSRFVGPGVETGVRNAALKKLFADPHFNVMDGLDTYIEDFGRADPLPASALRQMAQARFLGLFAETPSTPPDEDADLQLQSDDAAGRAGLEPGAGGDTGRQS